MIDDKANVSWKQGNPNHGPDMFNCFSGTASDLSLLITQVPQYLDVKLSEHICAGVSLGGHATWQILLGEPRVKAGIVVIGCPDYVRLMTDRAVRSKLETCTATDPPGRDFLGSKDFPPSLVAAIGERDPAGILFDRPSTPNSDCLPQPPSASQQQKLRPIVESRLAGKKVLCVSGGKDKLVPYACGKPFVTWLKKAVDPQSGWCKDLDIGIEDILDPEGRHEFSALMRKEAERWLCDLLAGEEKAGSTTRESKM